MSVGSSEIQIIDATNEQRDFRPYVAKLVFITLAVVTKGFYRFVVKRLKKNSFSTLSFLL